MSLPRERHVARITEVDHGLELSPSIAAAPALGDEAYLADGEDDWGPREVLAHIAEAAPYWHGELERILAGDAGAPVPFGRTPTDAARLAILSRDRSLPAFVLLDQLARETDALVPRLARLSDADLDRLGLHPVRGPQTVQAMIERSLTGHFEGHLTQLRTLTGA